MRSATRADHRALAALGALLLATLAAPAPAAGQTLRITAPADRQHIDMGLAWVNPGPSDDVPAETRDVTLTFAVTEAGPTDQLKLKVDGAAPVLFAVGPHTVTLLPGTHYATAWLVTAAGVERRTADGAPVVAVIRFYLARVCAVSADCLYGDPCTRAVCNGAVADTGDFFGGCRFGDAQGDPDCCVTPEWCRYRGQTLDPFGALYQCADVDGDAVGDCVQCTQGAHCQAVVDNEIAWRGMTCKQNPVCTADHWCQFTPTPCCCTEDAHCDDNNPCTADICLWDGTCACENTPIPGCCQPGEDDLRPGPPDYGCTPADADPCTYYTCLGVGAAATCRSGLKYPGCCDAEGDCTDPTKLNVCTDPDDSGHGTCADLGADPRYPGAGTCAYPERDPLCCTRDYECSDRYPESIGTCTDHAGQDWDRCEYAENPEYCQSPVDTIVINEVMVNPGTAPNWEPDYFGEWFEVFNPTDHDINMDGWIVHDLGEGEALESFTIGNAGFFNVPAGGFRLFNRSQHGSMIAGYVYGPQMSFNNWGADAIVLRDRDGVLQDIVVYDETWPWGEGASMALVSPYLDNADPASWRTASLFYGDPHWGNRGTPRYLNADAFDAALTAGLTCDDGDPCTADVCHLDQAEICSHRRLHDCCTAETATTSCNDLNACTADGCDPATNACVHALLPGCCAVDVDCADWYPATVPTAAEQAEFDLCAYKFCVGSVCRFGRRQDRPGCCVAAASPDFGCFDRNVCTTDACVVDGGQDPLGVLFNQCRFDLDPNGDGVTDCCRLNTDCDDHDVATLDVCDLLDDGRGPGVNRCWYRPDPNDCGPGADNPTCDDGSLMTDDVCCAGAADPDPSCPAADRCVHVWVPHRCGSTADCVDGLSCTADACEGGVCRHTEVAAGCCDTHADCNGPDKPPEMYCRTGYCLGRVCRYGPAIRDCCVTAEDCPAAPCRAYSCTNHSCVAQAVPGCCVTSADCPLSGAACTANVCLGDRCTAVAVPDCCADDNPAGPDPLCDDGDPCTADWCLLTGTAGVRQCRHFPTGGAGCCATPDRCPDDGVACTAPTCSAHVCGLEPVAECVAACHYRMSFAEGHAVYAGEYETLADLGWTAQDLGAGAAAPFWTLRPAGPLGPDPHLAFRPTATVADFDACAVLPRFEAGAAAHATLAFDWAADWNHGSVTLRALGRQAGAWEGALPLWFQPIAADAGSAHVNVLLPPALLGGDPLQVAFCVSGATTSAVAEVALDEVVLACGQAPQLAAIANQAAAKGQQKTVVDAFTVTEPDLSDTVTLRFLRRPFPWLTILNLRRLDEGPVWKADLRIAGAVCPAGPPYNYALRVRAADGALEHTQSFVLAVTGCP